MVPRCLIGWSLTGLFYIVVRYRVPWLMFCTMVHVGVMLEYCDMQQAIIVRLANSGVKAMAVSESEKRTYKALSNHLVHNLTSKQITMSLFAIVHVALFDMTTQTFLLTVILILVSVVFIKLYLSS